MSSYSWTLPAIPPGTIGLSNAEYLSQIDKLFGRDIWFDLSHQSSGGDYEVTPAGDWKMAEGKEALRQSIIRRIITNPGEWQTLPDFGAGARLFLKARNTRATREELKARIKAQVQSDPRVDSVEQIVIEEITDGFKIKVQILAKGRSLGNEPMTASVEVT
jgi:phage baseplate assembly protein W